MSVLLSFIALELTLQGVVGNIPHDFASVVVYGILAVMIYLVWYGSRKSSIDRFKSDSGTLPLEDR